MSGTGLGTGVGRRRCHSEQNTVSGAKELVKERDGEERGETGRLQEG